jgi:hypothetical protein
MPLAVGHLMSSAELNQFHGNLHGPVPVMHDHLPRARELGKILSSLGGINVIGRGLSRSQLKHKMKLLLRVLQHPFQHPYFETNAPSCRRRDMTENKSTFAAARQRSG